jgi:hypothetical protein
MIGDRFLTDVVFGNRNGMLTIRPAPFTSQGEPKAVLAVRQPGLGGDGAGLGPAPGLGCARWHRVCLVESPLPIVLLLLAVVV